MPETKSMMKRIEEGLARVSTFEKELEQLAAREEKAREEMRQSLLQTLHEYREEVARLNSLLSDERQKRRLRHRNARKQFESE